MQFTLREFSSTSLSVNRIYEKRMCVSKHKSYACAIELCVNHQIAITLIKILTYVSKKNLFSMLHFKATHICWDNVYILSFTRTI